MADLKVSVEASKGPLELALQQKKSLEKAVANYSENMIGYINASGSLEDIQKRLS